MAARSRARKRATRRRAGRTPTRRQHAGRRKVARRPAARKKAPARRKARRRARAGLPRVRGELPLNLRAFSCHARSHLRKLEREVDRAQASYRRRAARLLRRAAAAVEP